MVTTEAHSMAKALRQRGKPKVIIDGCDKIEVASIDSFPASDPPGWIESKARPCADGDPATKEQCPEQPARDAKRGATR
jgi:hypothetical protein